MSKGKKRRQIQTFPQNKEQVQSKPINSLLDNMIDGREFESLIGLKGVLNNINLVSEIRKGMDEIKDITNRSIICYLSNIVNSNIKAPISIDYNDDLPFTEMISTIKKEDKEIDIILVTPGGIAEQVAKFVDKLRPRFDRVNFLIPNIAMSAGTIFALSGNKIFMGANSYIGPIDPQVRNKDGQYIPAQAILTLIENIRERGEKYLKAGSNPPWTDLQLLRQIDSKEIGNALSASNYSIEIVEKYLYSYKFQEWKNHSSTGNPVSDEEKRKRAKEIAHLLCDHSQWKAHSRGITREDAWSECRLKIDSFEEIPGLERAIRRFWALLYWIFENTSIFKMFISENYCILRHDISLREKRSK